MSVDEEKLVKLRGAVEDLNEQIRLLRETNKAAQVKRAEAEQIAAEAVTRVGVLEGELAEADAAAKRWYRAASPWATPDGLAQALAAAEADKRAAARYRAIQYQVSAERKGGRCRFVFPEWLARWTHTNLMKGSVAGHLDDVCDAAISADEREGA